jgi:glycosyltransferase involved in cell wall biosynthesis
MKICIVSDVFYPYLMGGAERRYWEIAKRLAEEHEVHVYTMRWCDYPKEEEVSEIKIHRLNAPRGFYTEKRRSIGDALRFSLVLMPVALKKHGFDVIDANQFPFLHLLPVKILSKRDGTPLIVTWHEVWGDYWYAYMEKRFYGAVGRAVEWLSAKLPDKIIAVSHKTRNALISKLGVSPGKIGVARNGIDFGYIDAVKAEKVENKIVYAGRLLPHKNLDILIKCMPQVLKEFPDATLNIVGEGPSKKELLKLARDLNLQDRVEFLGEVEYGEVITQMKSASLFVLPSTREGFGISIVEAMACRTPVIGMNATDSGVSEVINGENGILCELHEIEDKIVDVLKNDSLRKGLIKNGYRYARGMDWNKRTEEIVAIYRKCLNNQS